MHLATLASNAPSATRTQSPLRSNKRRKYEDPLTSLLDDCQHARGVPTRLVSLQTLLFVFDRHWGSIHHQLRVDAEHALSAMIMQDSDTGVQQWATLGFASVLACAGDKLGTATANLLLVWQTAMRRIAQEPLCRVSCIFAHVVVILDLLDQSDVLHGIHTWLRDIRLQGPPVLCDSVFGFIRHALEVSQRDARLFKLGLEENVAAWFAHTWSGDLIMRSGNAFEAWDVVALLLQAAGDCRFHYDSPHGIDGVNLGLKLVEHTRARFLSSTIRTFVLSAQLPNDGPTDVSRQSASATVSVRPQVVTIAVNALETRAQAFLLLLDTSGPSLSATMLGSAVIACCAGLLTCAALRSDGIPGVAETFATASSLLRKVISEVGSSRWTLEERPLFLRVLQALVSPQCSPSQPKMILLQSGPDSGIINATRCSDRRPVAPDRRFSADLPNIWPAVPVSYHPNIVVASRLTRHR